MIMILIRNSTDTKGSTNLVNASLSLLLIQNKESVTQKHEPFPIVLPSLLFPIKIESRLTALNKLPDLSYSSTSLYAFPCLVSDLEENAAKSLS